MTWAISLIPRVERDDERSICPTNVVCARRDKIQCWICTESFGVEHCSVLRSIDVPSVPLCTACLHCPLQGGKRRERLLAVGMVVPLIEIWDLDFVEKKPCLVLGGTDGHTDSVHGLAWNKEHRNFLASASADKRVKIWDVVAETCGTTMEHHSEKVTAVAWNHHAPQVLLSGSSDHTVTWDDPEPQVLLSGSSDHTVVLNDGRMPSDSCYKWPVTAGVVSLAWDPHNEHSFVVSLADGIVKGYDIRTAKSDSTSEPSSTFTLHSHLRAVTSVSYNPLVPNLLATGSLDNWVRIWDLSDNQPYCVAHKETFSLGSVLSLSFLEDNPLMLAVGGVGLAFKACLLIENPSFTRNYGLNKGAQGSASVERLAGWDDDFTH